MNKQLKTFKNLTLLSLLAGCAFGTQAAPNLENPQNKAYQTKPLYFHYFKMDIPQDIDPDKKIIQAEFWGNQFRAFPIESQQAFTQLVNDRINVFKNHKFSQAALDYEKFKRENLRKINDPEISARYPNLNKTSALYKAIEYDQQHYEIIANSLQSLDSKFSSTLYSQFYFYVPEQHKYIMTKQTAQPAKDIVEEKEEVGHNFFKNIIQPLSVELLRNPKNMAVGPVVWLTPDSHPNIEYRMTSTEVPMEIYLLVSAGGLDDVKDELDEVIDNFGYWSDGQAKKLHSKSRTLANIKCNERCYAIGQSKRIEKSYVWCGWGIDGQRENLEKTYIQLEMRYEINDLKADIPVAKTAWETLTKSFVRRT